MLRLRVCKRFFPICVMRDEMLSKWLRVQLVDEKFYELKESILQSAPHGIWGMRRKLFLCRKCALDGEWKSNCCSACRENVFNSLKCEHVLVIRESCAAGDLKALQAAELSALGRLYYCFFINLMRHKALKVALPIDTCNPTWQATMMGSPLKF